jgi:tetratricopeptide (TPR) repeat protein
MRPSIRRLVVLAVCTAATTGWARPAELSEAVRRVLSDYVHAWSTLNPYALQALAAPGVPVFRDLVLSDELDALKATTVRLEDVRPLGRGQVAFREVHQNQLRGGTLVEVPLAVELTLAEERGQLVVRERVARALPPEAPARDLAAAAALLDQGNANEALVTLQRVLPALAGKPLAEAEGRYLIGLAYRDLARADKARESLEAALAVHPAFPWALNALAEQDVLAGAVQQALTRLDRSLATDPGQDSVRTLALVLRTALAAGTEAEVARLLAPWLLGEVRAPEQIAVERLSKAGEGPAAASLKALLHLQADQPSLAREVLLVSETKHHDDPLTRCLLGRSWLLLGRPDRAVKAFDELKEPPEGCEDVPLLRALALDDAGDSKRALEAYEALRGVPRYEGVALVRSARLLLRMGREAEGRAILDAARRVPLARAERVMLHDLMVENGYDPLR